MPPLKSDDPPEEGVIDGTAAGALGYVVPHSSIVLDGVQEDAAKGVNVPVVTGDPEKKFTPDEEELIR
jgi:hypothetical protein